MKLRQVELVDNNSRTITWIPSDLKPVQGKVLQDSKGRNWTILKAYKHEITSVEIQQDWKVG